MSRRSREKRATGRRPPDVRAEPASAAELAAAVEANEETMGDGAAYALACEQLGVDPDDGYMMMASFALEDDA